MLQILEGGNLLVRTGRIRRRYWLCLPGGSRELGRWGEWIALRHLRRLGWDILARNWRSGRGEVDLIGYDGQVLVFVEVKTRLAGAPVPPEESVDSDKERQLDRLALQFMTRYELFETPFRIDVVAVETQDQQDFVLRHYTN